jgi:uncharacterized protein (DUF433 family)
MTEGDLIRAFGASHVAKLTGLSATQLAKWDHIGFFRPEYAYEDRAAAYSRVYSLRDVIGLRTIAVLHDVHKVSIQHLKKVAERLKNLGVEHWADTKLYVVKRQVHFHVPGTSDVQGIWDGQYAMLPIIDVIQDVEKRVAEISVRGKQQIGKIERHRYVARNSPVIAGTRIPIAAIQRFHAAGYSVSQILEEYPTLTKKDVLAALEYEEKVA